jgi:hypothetical protein
VLQGERAELGREIRELNELRTDTSAFGQSRQGKEKASSLYRRRRIVFLRATRPSARRRCRLHPTSVGFANSSRANPPSRRRAGADVSSFAASATPICLIRSSRRRLRRPRQPNLDFEGGQKKKEELFFLLHIRDGCRLLRLPFRESERHRPIDGAGEKASRP